MKLQSNRFEKAGFLLISIPVMLFTACNNDSKEKTQKDVEDFKAYVKERRDSVDRYVDIKWDELQNRFDERKTQLDKDTAKMGQEIRADYDKAVRDWESFKAEYTAKMEEKMKLSQMDAIRNALAIEGVRNDYTDLTGKNALQEYRHFVQTVDANKDNYTKEQWTAVNVNWKALNGRKREIAKDISSGDEAEIMKLQLKYTGIKALNRPTADNE